jgi:hypothetical protein
MAQRLTKAQERALRKAVQRGAVMAACGFGGRAPPDVVEHPAFDRRSVIDRLWVRSLLWPAVAANSYAATELGHAALAALDQRRRRGRGDGA